MVKPSVRHGIAGYLWRGTWGLVRRWAARKQKLRDEEPWGFKGWSVALAGVQPQTPLFGCEVAPPLRLAASL